MLRHIGLEIDLSRPRFPPGASRHLVEKLEGAFAGTQVAPGQAKVGIHHADQGQSGKMMAFGDDLGADKKVDFTVTHANQNLRRCLCAAGHVAGHDGKPPVWEQIPGLLG